MFVDDSRSAQPRPAPHVPVAGLLTRSHADPDVEPEADLDLERARTGIVRRDPATATSVFRLRNGAEVTLVGPLGAYSGMYPRGYLRRLRATPTT